MRSLALLVCLLAGGTAPAAPAPLAISKAQFKHHYVSRDLPAGSRFATGGLADFDRDGRLDFSYAGNGQTLYWFRYGGADSWTSKSCGAHSGTLGGNAMDVDRDGWPDLISGRYWHRNNRDGTFTRYEYDAASHNVHDIVAADVDGNGIPDVVTLSDKYGLHWYTIPSNPRQNAPWPRKLVTDDVLTTKVGIHAGFFPRGAADLDGDGDVDIVAALYWYENTGKGATWTRRTLPFSRKKGPWSWSSRSWIADVNRDGRPDIVMTDADQADSRAAVLFSDGGKPPTFTVKELPKSAVGTRGSFHSLGVADFDGDGDLDVFTVEQEDTSIFPKGADPRWYIWENLDGKGGSWAERVIFEGKLGGHDAWIGDVDGDGDVDICSKVWAPWSGNANGGKEHADFLENLSGAGSAPAPAPTPAPAPAPAPTAPSVTELRLMNADTDQPVPGYAPIPAGATIDLAKTPSRNLTIVAITSPSTVGSVRFDLDGKAPYRIENLAPYALAGDASGNLHPWTLGLGQHALTATPYSGSSASGTAGTPRSLVFTLVDSNPAAVKAAEAVDADRGNANGDHAINDACAATAVAASPWSILPALLLFGMSIRRKREPGSRGLRLT